MNSANLKLITGLILWAMMLLPLQGWAQDKNLIGEFAAKEILEKDRIFRIYTERYNPEKQPLEYLSQYKDTVKVWVFFGSWCRESKKYIPGLVKTEQLANPQNVAFQYVGVDDSKKNPKALLNMFDIKYIPTVVVLKGSEELGRIIEKPLHTIETDLVEILKSTGIKK